MGCISATIAEVGGFRLICAGDKLFARAPGSGLPDHSLHADTVMHTALRCYGSGIHSHAFQRTR